MSVEIEIIKKVAGKAVGKAAQKSALKFVSARGASFLAKFVFKAYVVYKGAQVVYRLSGNDEKFEHYYCFHCRMELPEEKINNAFSDPKTESVLVKCSDTKSDKEYF